MNEETLQYVVAAGLVAAVLIVGYFNREKLQADQDRRDKVKERQKNPKPDGKTRKRS